MPNDEVQEIKDRLDITEVVADYVTLRKNGRSYWGKCPFHNEKTPSFTVSPEKQTFHCFGCGKGGDVFTFIMEIEHIDFKEALERLAERAGVELKHMGGPRGDYKKQRDILQDAQEFFRQCLGDAGGAPARAYLARRRIAPEDAARFGIGWSQQSWNSLSDKLRSLGFTENEIIDSGLASRGQSGSIYDRFRGRVMFPIYNSADRLIGFGGRIIDGEGAKYLNSPENSIFNKRNNLYLLNKAKNSMRSEKGSAILVEGYMDAIRAHMTGFTNTVASLGTALTEHQAILIKRMTGLCYICYDSDGAGQEAALRGMYILQKAGVSVRVVRLSGGKDPDEILQQPGGIEKFKLALDEALPLPLYHAVLRQKDMNIPEKSFAARNELLDGLASLSVFDIEPCIEKLGQILGVFPHELRAEIESRQEKIRGKNTSRMPEDRMPADDDQSDVSEDSAMEADGLECEFCSLLWNSPVIRAMFTADVVVPFIDSPSAQNITAALLSGEDPAQLEKRWRSTGDSECFSVIARGNALASQCGAGDSDSMEAAVKIARSLRNRHIEKRIATLRKKLIKGVATNDELREHQKLNALLKGGKFGK